MFAEELEDIYEIFEFVEFVLEKKQMHESCLELESQAGNCKKIIILVY